MLSKDDRESFTVLFNKIFQGNTVAIELMLMVMNCLHLWDDLIDKDKPVKDSSINDVFFFMMTDLAANRLWTPNMACLMRQVYFKWQAANKIERYNQGDMLAKAWMLRASCYDLFIMMADQLYGAEWAEQVAFVVYEYYGETLDAFTKECLAKQENKQCQVQ